MTQWSRGRKLLYCSAFLFKINGLYYFYIFMIKKLPYSHKLILPGLLLTLIVPTAYAETKVSVSSNTGSNTINGVTTTTTGKTKIIINGKEYVNDDSGGSHDISEDTDNGHVEVHVNSDKSSSPVKSLNDTNATVTPKPSIDIKPTIEKRKEEIKQLISKKKEEHAQQQKTIMDQLEQSLQTMLSGFGSLFKIFSNK